MSVAKLCRILSLSFSLVIVLLFPLTIYASTATPSEARPSGVYSNFVESLDEDVLIVSPNNATSTDDYLELDDFDTLEAPVFMSSGDDTVSNSVDYSGVQMCLAYYDMSGRIQHSFSQVNDNGYASIARPSDYASPYWFGFVLRKRALPPAGKYKVSVQFGSNTFISYDFTTFWFGVKYSNVSEQGSQIFVDGTYSSGDFSLSADVSIGASTSQFNISNFLKSDTGTPPWGGYVSINFTRLSSDAPVQGGSPDSGNVDQDINQSISNNTAQQVEQGDTIIELIKNTIQTISSQLTAFWNQLAGEFTNLYNKMNTQHAEQLEADRTNTEDIIAADDANTNKVTTAIESHGNFIIEGLKKLFIPSDEYFKAYFDDLYSWFSERFGFLSFPIDLLLVVIDIFVNSSQTDCVLVLPSFTIMEYLLWPEMSFNLTEFLNTNFSFLVVAIKTVTSIYLVMAFVQLCEEKWNEVMMN